ncbi:MAG TPA: NAD(+)/NADH kinase [Solirubrobacteraceae bacterium]|jgi:NAD+ kinase|nr:NAD(+)/NADH kinase [Solirubrobacteraceae bacterium]
MTPRRRALVLTHRRPQQTAAAFDALAAAARRAGATLVLDEAEAAKHGPATREGFVVARAQEAADGIDLCIVLGGDGTILAALRRLAGTGVPVFAVNFGEVGFLATIEPDDVAEGLDRAFAGDFEVLSLPAIAVDGLDGGSTYAINDVAVHRKVGERVATLAYGIGAEMVANVRCDGVVVASPAGSTGYNLANGGPVMAWGVEGYVVSFIAPHSITARPLVVAPGDTLSIHNMSVVPVEVSIDGRPASELEPWDAFTMRFVRDVACLAQAPGSSFYLRLRQKFGRLAV